MDQGLPVNFENTAATWQNMPMMTGFYTGLQNQSAQDNIRMLQEAFAREQAFKEKQRPIELSNMMSAGDLQKAQAGNLNALAAHTGVDTRLKEGTLDSDISAGISRNKTSEVENDSKKLALQAQSYQALLPIVSNPNIPNFQKVQTVMKGLQIQDPDGTVAQGLLANINKLPGVFQAQIDHIYKNMPSTKDLATKEAGDTKRTGMTTQAMRDVANINAQARLDVQNAKTQDAAKSILAAANSGKLTYEKAAASFHTLAMMAEDTGERQKYEELASQFEKAALSKAAAGVTGKVDTGAATGLPTQQPATVFGNTQGPPKGTAENPIKLD